MIHFNFIVNDIDAENIMGCLQESENKCLRKITDLVFELSVVSDPKEKEDFNSQIDWYKSHRKYLEELQYKMKNTLIKTHKNKKVYIVECHHESSSK